MNNQDLTVQVFKALRETFFSKSFAPIPFRLRPKRNTQDDPFDEYVVKVIDRELVDASCIKAPGPLINPDMVIVEKESFRSIEKKRLTDLSMLFGLEVKKLERGKSGSVARSTGLDYNTTPPCGTIRVYGHSGKPLDIRGFYLFVCLEESTASPDETVVSGLVVCDGDVLNADFDYYLSVVGRREKRIGLGTYKDGADRLRPMVIFSNPLGATVLDRAATLIHSDSSLEHGDKNLQKVFILRRTVSGNRYRDFQCYRIKEDVPDKNRVKLIVDPFPSPKKRVKTTQARGRFILPF